jgi:nitric oxide dioxygenase
MLQPKTIEIVKATAPVLEEHGETLTRHFYKRMFSHNPEVLPFFNPANQVAGSQQKALAGAICAYAGNIDNLDVLGGAVELIAQKHASLQVKPEHYPIVGENLLESIKEVLGDAATDDIINAWAEAYGFLADILIARESQIYTHHETSDSGWSGFKNFRIIRKEKESDIITSFYLIPADGSPVPIFKPGQYITVRMPTPCGHTTMRNYSLSDKPGHDYLRISVKREDGKDAQTPEGFVSHMLHRDIDVDSIIEIAPPCGEFCLDMDSIHDRPLVLIAGGIGITPINSILQSALDAMPDRPIILIHAVLNESVQPFKTIFNDLAAQHKNLNVYYRYSEKANSTPRSGHSSTGFVDKAYLESILTERDADYYFCGPKPFMVAIYHDLLAWGIPASQVHFEFFGPKQELERQAA